MKRSRRKDSRFSLSVFPYRGIPCPCIEHVKNGVLLSLSRQYFFLPFSHFGFFQSLDIVYTRILIANWHVIDIVLTVPCGLAIRNCGNQDCGHKPVFILCDNEKKVDSDMVINSEGSIAIERIRKKILMLLTLFSLIVIALIWLVGTDF